MTSFTETTHQINGGSLTVRTAGTGRAIVHLHSAGGPRLSHVVRTLAHHHTIHQPTCPGFEGTPEHPALNAVSDYADVIAEYIRTHCGGDCDIVAESFGGWVALWLAARHPDLVGQMVLEAPAGLCPPGKGGLPADPQERFRKLYAHPEKAPPDNRPIEMLQANGAVFMGFGGLRFDEELAAKLPEIKARTLVLMGTLDEIIPPETGHLLKSQLPLSHLTYIWDAAHSLEIDQPEKVAAIALDFLDRGESFIVRPGKDTAE
ncbi:MAG: alpha/beta hydrolase [Hyphomicrobiales bacterium]|nr:alpha/beta hydrolase [Hyphomicrobiales bacterium]